MHFGPCEPCILGMMTDTTKTHWDTGLSILCKATGKKKRINDSANDHRKVPIHYDGILVRFKHLDVLKSITGTGIACW